MDRIIVDENTVKDIIEHHFKQRPRKVRQLTHGLANFVYEVTTDEGDFVVRVSDAPQKINYFQKEQWAVEQARQRGVPIPEILEVGNEVVPSPYMIVQKVEGTLAMHFPDRLKVFREMGKYASLINTIPTEGFGQVFDWSSNRLSKNETLKEFMKKEWGMPNIVVGTDDILEIFEKNKMLEPDNLKQLKRNLKEMAKLDRTPQLNHSDIRLKNVLVDEEGNIKAILDWENAISHLAPEWELSIALHDLNIDEKEAFLDGYGLRPKDYREMIWLINTINIMNYGFVIAIMAEKKDEKGLDFYRLRLNGRYDLFSLAS